MSTKILWFEIPPHIMEATGDFYFTWVLPVILVVILILGIYNDIHIRKTLRWIRSLDEKAKR
jgi:hypothetical protein